MPNEADMNIMKVDVKDTDILKVVSVTRDGERLIVTVEGPDVETVTGPSARNLAYKTRLDHGYHNAGLEAFGGPYPFDKANNKDLSTHEELMDASNRMKDLVYRAQFRLTPGI